MSEAPARDLEPARAPIRRAMVPARSDGGLVFRGTVTPWSGAYGGDLMVHCASAARHGRTLGRLVSAQFEFLRAADPVADVHASSEVVRSGRSITHVRVDLEQSGSEKVAAMLIYETVPSDGGAGLASAVGDALPSARPEDLPVVTAAELAELPQEFGAYYASSRGLDVRYMSKPPYRTGDAATAADSEARNWTRVVEPVERGEAFSEAALCYIADDAALEPLLNQRGIAWTDDAASFVTLSHSMRFTGAIRADEWLYCSNRLSLDSGRYIETSGTISSASGRVVAVTHQLGIRVDRV